jgi:hypothetical protein
MPHDQNVGVDRVLVPVERVGPRLLLSPVPVPVPVRVPGRAVESPSHHPRRDGGEHAPAFIADLAGSRGRSCPTDYGAKLAMKRSWVLTAVRA